MLWQGGVGVQQLSCSDKGDQLACDMQRAALGLVRRCDSSGCTVRHTVVIPRCTQPVRTMSITAAYIHSRAAHSTWGAVVWMLSVAWSPAGVLLGFSWKASVVVGVLRALVAVFWLAGCSL